MQELLLQLGTGNKPSTDPRRFDHLISDVLPRSRNISERYWADGLYFGFQGAQPACTGFACMHHLINAPVRQWRVDSRGVPPVTGIEVWKGGLAMDGTDDLTQGATIDGALSWLRQQGYISSWFWATEPDDVFKALLSTCSVIFASKWHESMHESDYDSDEGKAAHPHGRIRIDTSDDTDDRHAYLFTGIDFARRRIRMKNSYSTAWALHGRCEFAFADVETLWAEGDCEAAIALEPRAVRT